VLLFKKTHNSKLFFHHQLTKEQHRSQLVTLVVPILKPGCLEQLVLLLLGLLASSSTKRTENTTSWRRSHHLTIPRDNDEEFTEGSKACIAIEFL
jgi:hypothetical protein